MILPGFDEILLYNSAYGCMMKREIFITERCNFWTFTSYHFVHHIMRNNENAKLNILWYSMQYIVIAFHINTKLYNSLIKKEKKIFDMSSKKRIYVTGINLLKIIFYYRLSISIVGTLYSIATNDKILNYLRHSFFQVFTVFKQVLKKPKTRFQVSINSF